MNALRLSITFTLALAVAAYAGADDSWVGQKVMQTKPDVKFGENNDDGQKYFPLKGVVFTVLKEREGWLRIRGDDTKEGWAQKEEFVLLADAPAVYTDMIRVDEKNTWAWDMRGLAWRQKGEVENAIKDYSEAIRLDPKHVSAFNNRGNAWHDKHEYDKAIKDYDEAIRLDPKCAAAFVNRGNTWLAHKSTTRRSRITTRPSASTPNTPMHSSTGAMPGATSMSTTRRSRIATRPSASIPSTL